MTDTPHLGLPLIEAAQAQKHVTHNEALALLDILVQLSVTSRALSAPPASPAENSRYIVKATGTGAFAGKDNQIAQYSGGGWLFYPPRTGWLAFVTDEGALLAWNGSAWVAAVSGSGGISELQNLALLGVGTTADSTNPFTAKLNNALWVAKTTGEGGDGTLRYKLSKESAAKTLSFLFQDNFSGRAEIGLTGDDDFHFKVSADGTNWIDALIIDKSTGAAKVNSGFCLAGDISPTISADQNDWNPTGLSAASVLRVDGGAASRNITGLAGGSDGRIVAIVNAGANSIVLKDTSVSSSASNRFSFGADVTLAAKQSAVLWYDATDSRWKLLAGPGSGGGGGSVSSVFGRTGAVVAASGDYSISQIANAREVLTANRTYYVRTDGSDSNNGLADSAGGAFLTIQKAINTAAALDLGIYDVTIQVGNGTYTGANTFKSLVGAGKVIINGDAATPSNVVIGTTSANCFTADSVSGTYSIRGVKLTATTSGSGIAATRSAVEFENVEFGAVASGSMHIKSMKGALITATGNYKVSGGGYRHIYCFDATVELGQKTIEFSNSPAFTTFVDVPVFGYASVWGMTFTNGGTVTGTRYTVAANGVIFTNGGGASYLPGNAAGSTATGGQYL